MPHLTENLTLGPKTGSLEGARPPKRVRTTNFSLNCGTFSQFVIFSKSTEIGDSIRWHHFLRLSSLQSLPGRTLQPSKSTFQSILQISLEIAIFTFFKTPISKVNCLVKLSVFSHCIIFEKVSKLETLWGGRGFKCPGRLEKRKKAQFREKIANLILKCTFEGSKVLAGGGQTLENRKNLCHFTKPPFSALCEKWSFFWHKMTDAFYRKLDFRA